MEIQEFYELVRRYTAQNRDLGRSLESGPSVSNLLEYSAQRNSRGVIEAWNQQPREHLGCMICVSSLNLVFQPTKKLKADSFIVGPARDEIFDDVIWHEKFC